MDDIDAAQTADAFFLGLALDERRRQRDGAPRVAVRDCVGCGEEIDPRRRAAQPDADRCTECQGRWEKYGV